MSLKRLLDTMKKQTVLLGELDRFLMSLESQDYGFREFLRTSYGDGPNRGRGEFHPSQISVESPRCIVLDKIGAPCTGKRVDAKGRRIFDVGHHFGFMLQEYLWTMGILLGEWRCRECTHRWLDPDNPSPRKCPNCGKELWIWVNLDYLEYPVSIPEYSIKGKADAVLLTESGKRVLEIKTIKNRTMRGEQSYCFEALVEPLEGHLKQVNMYMHGLDIDSGLVLYGAKNTQELKEFPVKKMFELYVQPQLETVMEVKSALENKVLPPRVCQKITEAPARWCVYNEACFSDKGFAELDNRGCGLDAEGGVENVEESDCSG
jgi:hypothetical protein